MERGYLYCDVFVADIIFIMVVIIPNRKIAPVKKKLNPGNGKNSNNERIK